MEIKNKIETSTDQESVSGTSMNTERLQKVYVPIFSLLIAILMTISIMVVLSFS